MFHKLYLEKMLLGDSMPLARLHALWTLQGLSKLDKDIVKSARINYLAGGATSVERDVSYKVTPRAIQNYDGTVLTNLTACLLYTSPSPRDVEESRMPSSA